MNLFGNMDEEDNNVKLFHGSCEKIEKPLYGYGRFDNDYGRGFYTTKIFEKAASWARNMGNSDKAIVNEYEINLSPLNVVNLKDYGVLAWIAEIAANRAIKSELSEEFLPEFVEKYRPNTSKADIIIGYRADDSYTDVVSAFVDGLLNCDEVKRLFYRGNLGEQYFIKSEKAFQALHFSCYSDVSHYVNAEQTTQEVIARQEVFRFINQRRLAIAKRFYVPPITIIDAIDHDYVYNKEL